MTTRPEVPREKLSDAQRAALDILNRLVQLDPQALCNLCEYRTEVNDALEKSDLPVILLEDGGVMRLGVIGLLGGVLNTKTVRLTGHYEDDGALFKFSFTEWPE